MPLEKNIKEKMSFPYELVQALGIKHEEERMKHYGWQKNNTHKGSCSTISEINSMVALYTLTA